MKKGEWSSLVETKGKNWHSMPIEEILKELDTTEEGLTDKEAEERLKKYGYNELRGKKIRTIFEY